MDPARQHDAMVKLLFDPAVREAFANDRAAALRELGLGDDDARPFLSVDLRGLELDASLRRDYLLSALCRPFPLTATALGALPGGARHLESFLGSPALFGTASARTLAFGAHLAKLLELDLWKLPRPVTGFLESFLKFERGLADHASQVRAAVSRGEPAPRLPVFDPERLADVKPRLSGWVLVAELPVPPAVFRTALDGAGPEDAWHRVVSGRLSFDRVAAVARADALPVTLVARAEAKGTSVERAGAGGVSPLVDVLHRTAEVPGRHGAFISSLDGTRTLAQLPEQDRRLAKALLEQGLVDG